MNQPAPVPYFDDWTTQMQYSNPYVGTPLYTGNTTTGMTFTSGTAGSTVSMNVTYST